MHPGRIGLLGGESTGKSALARALADALPAAVVEERLRHFVASHGRPPLPAEQEQVFRDQQEAVAVALTAAGASGLSWVVADPLPLMTAVYSVVYFDDHSLLQRGLDDARAYDVVLWCAPDIPWEAEHGVRDGADYRRRADEVIEDYVAPHLTLHRISGSPESRLATALALLDSPPS